MIEFTNTIPHPWAMMIHSDNAFATNRAMMNSDFLHHVTLKAIADSIQRLNFL